MNNRAMLISRFFALNATAHKELQEYHPLRGFFEGSRVEFFQQLTEKDISVKTGALYSLLSGTILKIQKKQLTAIFAHYEDEGVLLWLDNHVYDQDFDNFLRREQVLAWIPDRFADLVQLITETKFNFLGVPQVVGNAADIPPVRQEMREAEMLKEYLQERDERLASIAEQIQAPKVIATDDSIFLEFCIWTRYFGAVIKLRCRFGPDIPFNYEYSLLTSAVGDWFTPI